jgi:opacity protein-like surface antigen
MQLTRALAASLALAGAVFAQTADGPGRPAVGLFGGYQGWSLWHSNYDDRPGGKLAQGSVFGTRGGFEINRHLGLEGAYTYSANNLRLFRDQGTQVGFGARSHHISLNPVWSFRGRDAKIRPYVTAGAGALFFKATEEARRDIGLPVNSELGAKSMKTDLMPAFNWGGGLKISLTPLATLRFDARNILTRQPHFGLPQNNLIPNGVFVAPGGIGSGLQLTAGIGFNLSGEDSARARTIPPPPPPRAARNAKTLRVNLAGGTSPISPAGVVKLIASTDAPDPTAIRYKWTVNSLGAEAAGSEFEFYGKGREPGDYKICATASSTDREWAPGSECYTVTVEPFVPVRVTISEPVRINLGESTKFTAKADGPGSDAVVYEWLLNGRTVPGEPGGTYTFRSENRQPAVYEVCVTGGVNGVLSQKACSSANVVPCTNPTVSFGAMPSGEIFAGEKLNIPVIVQPGSCGSPVRVSYRAGDGVITGNGDTGVFDTTNVAFDRTNRSKLQRRSVPVIVTATDDKGNTATASTNVIVKLAAAAQRLDDVLFAASGSRVNNCGKRVLLEMLAPRLRDDPEASVLLVGHMDEAESGAAVSPARKGKKGAHRKAVAAGGSGRNLDRARVINAAAAISAGEGICPSLELSRVKVAFAGKAKGGDMRPTFCGSSTEVRATKRAGAKPDMRAAFRRVEVWIVPNGAAMPPGLTVRDAPEAEIKALHCPR